MRSVLRYQLTAYPFADPRLHAQMRRLLSLDGARHSPLLKGPYIGASGLAEVTKCGRARQDRHRCPSVPLGLLK